MATTPLRLSDSFRDNTPQARLETLLACGWWEFDIARQQLHLSAPARALLQLPPHQSANRESIVRLTHAADRQKLESAWSAALRGVPYELEFQLRLGGHMQHAWEKVEVDLDDDGHPVRLFGVMQIINRFRQSPESTANPAHYDSLTQLPNRRLLTEILEQGLRIAKRNKQNLAVLFLDLDRFKHVNDSLGHAAGDTLLQQVALRMKSCLRDSDMVARQGGDEFIIVLHDVNGEAETGMVALKLIETICAPYQIANTEVFIGTSIGIALYPRDGSDAAILIQNADMAMYEAKESGRETLRFFDPAMGERTAQRQRLEVELRQALARNEFRLLYQPIIDIESGAVTGAEALIRWAHPQRGLLAPDQFIAIAEEIGLVREIGRWVIGEGCRQWARWAGSGLELQLTVNVSSRQIPDGLPLEWLKTTLSDHGVPPGRLVIEITESCLLVDNMQTLYWLEAIRNMGIKLSIDDFGTGYASIAYLRRLKLDSLKIDRSFVMNMLDDPAQLGLVKSMIAIGGHMEMLVIAEGVESAEVLQALHTLGCRYAQGFHISHPVLNERIEALIANAPRIGFDARTSSITKDKS